MARMNGKLSELEVELAPLKAVCENFPIGFAFVDADFCFRWANEALVSVIGERAESLIGKSIEAGLPRLWPTTKSLFELALSGETILNHHIKGNAALPGGLRSWRTSFFPIRQGEAIIGVGVLVNDESARIKTVADLLARNNLYAMLARTNKAATRSGSVDELYRELCSIAVDTGHFKFAWVGVPDGDRLIVAASAGNDDGYMNEIVVSLDEDDPRSSGPTGRAFRLGHWFVINDFLQSPMTSPWRESAQRAGLLGIAAFPIKSRHKTVAVLSLYASIPDFFTDELIETLSQITPLVSFAIDALDKESERKRTYAELEASENRYRSLISNLDVGVVLQNTANEVLYVNGSALEILGLDDDDAAGLSFSNPRFNWVTEDDEIFPVDLLPSTVSARTGTKVHGAVIGLNDLKTGRRRWVQFNATPELNQNGGFDQVFVTLVDISERRRSETERQILTAAIEQSGEMVVITDSNGLIQYVNPAFEKVTGYSRQEAIGQNPRILASGKHDAAFYEQLWAKISSGEIWYGQIINKRKDGTLFSEEVNISPVIDMAGNIVNYVAIKRDITDQIKLEAQFQQAQKMESIGRLAGGVAHDFNNLLTVINGYSDMLIHPLPMDHAMRSSLQEIRQAGERSASLTRQLLAFSRQQVLEPAILDVNVVIGGAEKMLRRLIGEDIAVVTLLDPAAFHVKADAGQLEQVILNLAINARDAMPKGGHLTIETSNTILDEPSVKGELDVLPGEYLVISIADTGNGMTDEVKSSLYEPFFTTKPSGKGTGLGLAVVHGIVEQSGGHIKLDSELGRGSTFTIFLPRSIEPPPNARSANAVPLMPKGTESILLVEDDVGVRVISQQVLEQCGYTVLAAKDASDAIYKASSQASPIDLLVTDVVMPDMAGPVLAERLTAAHPGLKVLFISGYTNDAVLNYGIRHEKVNFLQKPFAPSKLARAVRTALDGTK